MNADAVVYLDSSTLVKLVVREPESNALAGHLRERPSRVSCALARMEVVRAVGGHGQPSLNRARHLLARISLLRLDDALLDEAAALTLADAAQIMGLTVIASAWRSNHGPSGRLTPSFITSSARYQRW